MLYWGVGGKKGKKRGEKASCFMSGSLLHYTVCIGMSNVALRINSMIVYDDVGASVVFFGGGKGKKGGWVFWGGVLFGVLGSY